MYNPTLRLVKQDELTWQELDDNFEQLVGEFTRVDLKNAEQDADILALQGAAGVTTLQDLSDVNVTGAVNGMVLYFDGTNWVANYPLSSGGGGTTLPTGTANGDILYWDSGTNSWSATAAGSGASVSIGGTAPASPSNGDLWYDDGSVNASAGLYVWDATAGAWVDSTGSGGGGGTTLPTATNDWDMLVWDSTNSQWVVTDAIDAGTF